MAQITLVPNSRPISWPSVVYGDGDRVRLDLRAGEGWFDDDGYLRFFSVRFSDGSVGNYKLLPQNQTTDTVIRVVKDFLLPFGLSVASNKIYSGEMLVANVALEVFSQLGEIVIGNYLERVRIENSAYYDLADGWCSIKRPLQAK